MIRRHRLLRAARAGDAKAADTLLRLVRAEVGDVFLDVRSGVAVPVPGHAAGPPGAWVDRVAAEVARCPRLDGGFRRPGPPDVGPRSQGRRAAGPYRRKLCRWPGSPHRTATSSCSSTMSSWSGGGRAWCVRPPRRRRRTPDRRGRPRGCGLACGPELGGALNGRSLPRSDAARGLRSTNTARVTGLARSPCGRRHLPRRVSRTWHEPRKPVRYAAVGGPNQVVSASASPSWVRSPTQATYPSGRINTAVGAVTAPSAGSSHVPTYLASIN